MEVRPFDRVAASVSPYGRLRLERQTCPVARRVARPGREMEKVGKT